MSRGNFVIFLMLLAAAAAGGGAIWFHHQQTKRIREFLTPEVANMIATAPDAELIHVRTTESLDPATETVVIRTKIIDRKSIGSARGYINLRAALVKDASYDWELKINKFGLDLPDPLWTYLLDFKNGTDEVRLYFDLDQAVMKIDWSENIVSIAPIADGLRKFFEEQFAAPPAEQPAAIPAAKPAEN